jgi:hypothetical protein
VFFFFLSVCLLGFPVQCVFPLFVLPVSLPSSQFLSPVLGPCSLWFWFLLCPLFFSCFSPLCYWLVRPLFSPKIPPVLPLSFPPLPSLFFSNDFRFNSPAPSPQLCSVFYRAPACRKLLPLFINPWAGSWARDRGVVALNCRICFLLNRPGPCETEGMVNSGIKTASSCIKNWQIVVWFLMFWNVSIGSLNQ